jgi:hypothetical protein
VRHWDLKVSASSIQEPQRLLRFLSGAINGCGGWILSRNCSCAGVVQLNFEFERGICIEIYTAMIASGLSLSPRSHLRLTELCQLTHCLSESWWSDIAAVELVVRTDQLSAPLDIAPELLVAA